MAKLIVWRVVGLYVMGALAVGVICPSRDPEYLQAVENGEPGAGSSPWVFGIMKLRITTFLPDAINFMILLSGFSCGNTFLYTASRSLYSLAQNGQAPKIFLKCSKKGIPYVAGKSAAQLRAGLICFRQGDDLVEDGFCLRFRKNAHCCFSCARLSPATGRC